MENNVLENVAETEEAKISEINIEDEMGYPNPDSPNVTDSNYKEVFEKYDITDAEASNMLDIMQKYKRGIKANYYEMLPNEFKKIAEGLYMMARKEGDTTTTKNVAAKFLLDQLMNDAEINQAFDDYKNNILDTVNEMNTEYSKLITQAFNDVFDNIDKIEASDPEKAEKIKSIKAAFDDAMTFNKQLEFVWSTTANKLNKLVKRFDNECFYFNKTVNSTDVKIPKIEELVDVIYNHLLTMTEEPKYTIEDIKKLIVVICRTTAYKLDVVRNVEDLAYVYRLVNTIYLYKYIDNPVNSDEENLLFGNIAKVLDCIITK